MQFETKGQLFYKQYCLANIWKLMLYYYDLSTTQNITIL